MEIVPPPHAILSRYAPAEGGYFKHGWFLLAVYKCYFRRLKIQSPAKAKRAFRSSISKPKVYPNSSSLE